MNKTTQFGWTDNTKAGTYKFSPKGNKQVQVNPLVSGLEAEANFTTTENNALTYKSTTNYVLDFFGNGAALRTRSKDEVIQIFSKAFAEDRLLALKTLFYIRDRENGQGERQTFRTILNWLAVNYPDIVKKNFGHVPFYGRWDDLFYSFFNTPLEKHVMILVDLQLREDWNKMKEGKPISLLAKWLPSNNTSNKDVVRMAYQISNHLGWSPKKYRKTLSQLRTYLDVVEVKMCDKRWDQIDFERVPSKASLNYRKAFSKNANERYTQYLGKVEKGEAKINAKTLYPYDILRTVVENQRGDVNALKAADLQWKALPNYVEDCGNSICVCDVSGSMNGLPLYVSISLGIYFAERNFGPFKDVFMTFSNEPVFHRIIGNNLLEKWKNFNRKGWTLNTDLVSVFRLILDTALKNKVQQKDMPEKVFIITDMEFDDCTSNSSSTNFDMIDQMYRNSGYNRPGLIFWNVNSRNDNSPITQKDKNVCLVSGCSPSILKSILGKKILSPIDVMLETINNKRYDRIVI